MTFSAGTSHSLPKINEDDVVVLDGACEIASMSSMVLMTFLSSSTPW